LCRRLGCIPEARSSYEKALALLEPVNDQQQPERRFPIRRLREVQ
jgi:predicted RNA polymerase sigma factor